MDQTSMKIIIIGGGNVGGFVINNIHDFTEKFEVVGILDDDLSKVGTELWGVKVLGQISDIKNILNKDNNIGVVISIANPLVKERIINSLAQYKNIIYPNFIHIKTWISSEVKLGVGNIIYPGVSINYESEIHDFTTINMNVSLGHNCTLNNFVTLSPAVNLAGFTFVGKSSFVGIGACCVQGLKIGENSLIGAGAVIIRDVEDGATVVGNPGRIIKQK